ncbi:hypothetical protein QFC22_005337 [Naganishia vaughanmartiniae]|uniref:Uncharacterized protein n=1 Tax=Naganishia vaughanmartiniae TaxID=1424756 RepID=A0ACC2WV62_9TREE|nr:hypothetical protein QFC22_005337 [Naganishia vaughanmartiniae]
MSKQITSATRSVRLLHARNKAPATSLAFFGKHRILGNKDKVMIPASETSTRQGRNLHDNKKPMMTPSAPLAQLGREHVPEAEALRWFFSDLLFGKKVPGVKAQARGGSVA